MNWKKEILAILFGALLFSIAIQSGWISPANTFFENVLNAIVLLVVKSIIVGLLAGFR